MILRVCYLVVCTLFTGDIGDQGEQWLRTRYGETPGVLPSQLLKVSHHGSAEPNNPALVAVIAPEVAVIGVGPATRTATPRTERLTAWVRAAIYRTDQQGTILIESDGTGYTATPRPDIRIASARTNR